MRLVKTKLIRYFVNVILYAVVLITATYMAYIIPEDMFIVKNFCLPFGLATVIAIFISMILATLNEISTIIVVNITRRGQQ